METSCSILISVLGIVTLPVLASTNSTLTTTAEINDFLSQPTAHKATFHIKGVALNGQSDDLPRPTVIQDESGRAEVYLKHDQSVIVGDILDLAGFASTTQIQEHIERGVYATQATVCGHRQVAPIQKSIHSLDETGDDLSSISIDGIVVDIFKDEVDNRNTFLLLKDKSSILPVSYFGAKPISGLVNSRLRVTGIYHRTVSGIRKFSGPYVDAMDFEVLLPPPTDPFDAPALEELIYLTPLEVAAMDRQTVTGNSLAVWGKNKVMLRDSNGRIVNITLLPNVQLPNFNQRLVVVGWPETDLFRINLSHARWKSIGNATKEVESAEFATPSAILSNNDEILKVDDRFQGRLIKMEGIIQSLPSEGSPDQRLYLRCDNQTIPIERGFGMKIPPKVSQGCKVRVTGRCLLDTGIWSKFDVFPRVKGFSIILRQQSDIEILSYAPWWTPKRLSVVIAFLLILCLVILAWNISLNKLADRRGQALARAEIDKVSNQLKVNERTRLAVELHDSISQALAGIGYQLTSSATAIDQDANTAKQRIHTAEQMLSSCRTELRHCLYDLRSNMLEETDFSTAIRKTLSQLEGDARIILRVNVDRSLLHDATAHAILSIIRELVANAVHHGVAHTIRIAGCVDNNQIQFSVRDDGIGFDPSHCKGPRQGHFGIEGIRDRLRKVKGTLTISSSAAGTKATFIIPICRTTHNEKT